MEQNDIADLIDRRKLLVLLNEWKKKVVLTADDVIGMIKSQQSINGAVAFGYAVINDKFESIIKELRDANAMIVNNIRGRYGHWIVLFEDVYDVYKCSSCGEESFKKTKHCPNCGAEMYEEKPNEHV